MSPATLARQQDADYSFPADMYSFAIILWEIVTRGLPYEEFGNFTAKIAHHVCEGGRPPIDNTDHPLAATMQRCWLEDPAKRPTFAEALTLLNQMEPLPRSHVATQSESIAVVVVAETVGDEMRALLVEHNLSQYFDALVESGFDDLEALGEITFEDAMEIDGMRRGHARRLLKCVAKPNAVKTASSSESRRVNSLHAVEMSEMASRRATNTSGSNDDYDDSTG